MSHQLQSPGGRVSSDSGAKSEQAAEFSVLHARSPALVEDLGAVSRASGTPIESVRPASAKLFLLPPLPLRAGHLTCGDLVDLYMAHYAGRDSTRVQRLTWWKRMVGHIPLQDLSDDHIHAALEDLAQRNSRYFAGKDAEGKPILRAKQNPVSGATVNRYAASFAAVITWAIKRRVAPKGFVHPCRSIERRPESDGKTRFLSDTERGRLLEACKASTWPRLYALVLLALTTGARKSELLGLRWADLDFERLVAHCGRTKNGDPKVLPLVPTVVDALLPFKGATSTHVFESSRRKGQAFAFEPKFAEALASARVKAFRFHDLRHSCASMLASSGATLLEIGDVLGHRQLAMTRRYSHLTTQHKAALINRVLGDIR
jgi:integrase